MNISTSTVQQRRRKPAQSVVEDEDASQLKLGPEFAVKQVTHEGAETDLITLNLSEARLLINAALKKRREEQTGMVDEENDANDEEDEDFSNSNEVLRKTQEYLSVFARFRTEQTVGAVEQQFKTPDLADLHPFEVAQLGSLACDEAEEAKTLIPSLQHKKTDQELQVLLDNLRRFG